MVNFSGGGADSTVINSMFAKLAKHGIAVVVATGNSGEVCNLDSPASISNVNPLQSVGALAKQGDPVGYKAGQDLATYSNFGTAAAKCATIYNQGCYDLADPNTGELAVGCGTSFAAPVHSAQNHCVFRFKS